MEEKLRTEIATYLWLEENCPDVPIPILHAFGLPDGSIVCILISVSDFSLLLTNLLSSHTQPTRRFGNGRCGMRRWLCSLTGRPVPARHVRRSGRHGLGTGFLLISEAKGRTLALSWFNHCRDAFYRERLFRSLARMQLAMNS